MSSEHAHELLQAAYGRPMPAPGDEAWIKTSNPDSSSSSSRRVSSATVVRNTTLCLRRPSDKRFDKVTGAPKSIYVFSVLKEQHFMCVFRCRCVYIVC